MVLSYNRSGGNEVFVTTLLQPALAPVYQRIEEDMRRRVECGQWAPGNMIPGRKDLAREYGVDLRTVQRAIGALIGDGTLTAHTGRGTFVRSGSSAGAGRAAGAPRALRTLGIILNQTKTSSDPGLRWVYQSIHAGVRSAARKFRLVTFDTHGETPEDLVASEADALDFLERGSLAGALLFPGAGPATEPQMRRIQALGIPLVMVDRHPDTISCDFVGVDNAYGARQAVDYLISLGHRRIAFLAPDENVTSIKERRNGYRSALERGRIPADERLEFRPPYQACLTTAGLDGELAQIANRIKLMADRPTALFSVNDFMAHHMIRLLAQAGMQVPEDISVIGFDDIDGNSSEPLFLTTMRQSFDALGERAAQLLLELLERKGEAEDGVVSRRCVLLPTTLVVRQSCRRREEM